VRRAPVVLFAYNRPDHTHRTVEALRANAGAGETDLQIYSDGPKSDLQVEAVEGVRSLLRRIDGFRTVTVVERQHNMGLARSVISGVSEMLERNWAVVVMEDDMVTSRDFLDFMNAALSTYRHRPDIFSVTGYNYPLPIPDDYPEDAYLSYRNSSWGWGTWPDRWNKVDWTVGDFEQFLTDQAAQNRFALGGDDLLPMLRKQLGGGIDSWSIRFAYAHARHDATCLHAVRSRLHNIGFDGSGVHCGVSSDYDVELDDVPRPFKLRPDLAVDERIQRIFNSRFRPRSTPFQPTTLRHLAGRALRKIARTARSRLGS
jgi:hypothetical protein